MGPGDRPGHTGVSETATKRSALGVAAVSAFTTAFMGSAVNIALPAIGAEFRMDAVLLSWVATAYVLAAAVGLLPAGRLADIYGRKRFYAIGMIIFTSASLLAALAFSTPILLAARILQGLGSAMSFATGTAIVISVFPPGERGRALGIAVAAVYLGLSAGPSVGGILTQQLGWRSVFGLVVLLGAIAVYLVFWGLKGEWAEARGEKFDLTGSIIYGLGLVALIQGIALLPDLRSLILILGGLLGLALFVGWEIRVANPVFDLALFRTNRVFAFSSLAALIHYWATFAVTLLLSLYLQKIKGLSPQSAGLVLLAQPIFMAALSPLAGRLSDRIDPRIVASVGMSLSAVGLALLTTLDNDSSLVFIVACLILLGVGFALFSSPNMNAIMGSVERRLFGIASGAVATMRLLGQMLSMGIATCIFAVYIGRVEIAAQHYPALVTSVRAAFIIFALLCGLGIIASLARGRIEPGAPLTRPGPAPGKR